MLLIGCGSNIARCYKPLPDVTNVEVNDYIGPLKAAPLGSMDINQLIDNVLAEDYVLIGTADFTGDGSKIGWRHGSSKIDALKESRQGIGGDFKRDEVFDDGVIPDFAHYQLRSSSFLARMRSLRDFLASFRSSRASSALYLSSSRILPLHLRQCVGCSFVVSIQEPSSWLRFQVRS